MILPVNLRISRVHLASRRKQTLVAVLGVTFGIAIFVFMMSFIKGLNKVLEDIMMSVTPDIHMYNDVKTDYSNSITGRYFKAYTGNWVIVHHPRPKQVSKNLKNAPGIIDELKKNNEIQVVSPSLSSQVFFNYGPVQLNAIADGVDIMAENRLFNLSEKMNGGRIEDLLATNNGLILGYRLAGKLNLQLGDLVTATAPSGTQMRFRLVGTYKFGIATMDEGRAYINLVSMQQLLGRNRDYITDIRLKCKKLDRAPAIAISLSKKYGYRTDDWKKINAPLEAGNKLRDAITFSVSITILIVAAFGIYNIMNMVITGKMKDIAILKAEGFSGKDIVQIFLSQSLFIGFIGALTGLILGFVLSYLMSLVKFPSDEYILIEYYPMLFDYKFYVMGIVFGLITTLVAGLVPAIKASKVDPVAILRG